MGRAFNRAQRRALWLFAGGCCEECGVNLKADFHADHVIPWSKKGATDVINGRALCAKCNLSKGGKSMTTNRSRYKWQEEALKAWLEKRRVADDFLLSACPGAGKTRFAMRGARQMLDDGSIERVVAVTPSRNLCRSWKDGAVREGVEIAEDWLDDREGVTLMRGMSGFVITYQGLTARSVEVLRKFCSRYRTLVIFDEPHHLTEDDEIEQTWGPRASNAFAPSRFRLLTTGTPWRTDQSSIPWTCYDEDGFVKMDFQYTYRDGVRDGVVRPVYFHYEDSDNCRYAVGDDEIVFTSLLDVPESETGRTLATIFRPFDDWTTRILDRAIEKLNWIRAEEHSNAAGLVVCRDTREASKVRSLIAERIGSDHVALAISDDGGNAVIEQFRENSQKIIVAVQMVAEGTDIPRIRVGVYLTPRRTELTWHQLIGRTNRTTDAEEDQVFTAHWFIPKLPIFCKYAQSYEDDVRIALKDREAKEEREEKGKDWQDRPFVPLEASGIDGGTVVRGEEFTAGQMNAVRDSARGHKPTLKSWRTICA